MSSHADAGPSPQPRAVWAVAFACAISFDAGDAAAEEAATEVPAVEVPAVEEDAVLAEDALHRSPRSPHHVPPQRHGDAQARVAPARRAR
ncbi:hypothetical protein [Pseudonocardia sp. N23]|uniref:hypothetical protein n=1 Tax=Pseudonocardia sp. N23 TaxID=1987376 RepID=UPI000BFE6D8A|nr:hypothetical protein [Pseudonocardia sp. N23]GAY07778.1 hypothetical protein TOK_4055 [Pseudonocardia sp. N23]